MTKEFWKNPGKEIFIDGLGGMASGLFATLIIGTIIVQIGGLIPGAIGTYLFMIGKLASTMTGRVPVSEPQSVLVRVRWCRYRQRPPACAVHSRAKCWQARCWSAEHWIPA